MSERINTLNRIAKHSKSLASPLREAGFTLIELMVTVGIVGILAMLASPTYQEYVMRGKIPEATSNLALKRVQMEQWFQDNRTYVGATGCAADTSTSQYFDFSCPVQTATTYTIQAVGKNSMLGFTYTIDQSNVKTTVAVPASWSQHSPNTCWVTKKGGIC